MKKTLFFALILLISVCGSCLAVGAGVGVRSMAMGGTGIAIANDITAAYFNPAGLMYGPENFECQAFGGGAMQGIAGIGEALSSGTDFISDNFEQDYDLAASLSGGLGFSIKKVGISAIADGFAKFKKPANNVNMNIYGNVNASLPLTLGSTFTTPGLPFASMSVGVNLKAINEGIITTSVTSTGAMGIGTMSTTFGSGFGFDIGAAAKLTPLVSVGGVIRNLSASTSRLKTSKTIYVDIVTGDTTEDAETETKSSHTLPPEVGIGVGVLIPLTGTLIAYDMENYSAADPDHPNKTDSYTDTHIGVEQGMYFNILMLRGGYYTYGPTQDSFFTYGLGLNMGPLSLGFAAANSVKNSRDSISSAQLGMAF